MEKITAYEIGISQQIGTYADAVRVPAGYDQIFVSGTPGLAPDGTLDSDITAQSHQLWKNIESMLAEAGASIADIVSVHHWLKSEDDIPAYLEVRKQYIKHQPTYMLGVIPSFVRPGFLVEVEVIAAVLPVGAPHA
jgi:enamine deaminase RidA (YjgF/YER057c/UK114 family)